MDTFEDTNGTASRGHLWGRTARSLDTRSIMLTERSYRPSMRIPRHSHEYPGFCLVLEGSFDRSFGTRTQSCQPSTLTFHPSGEYHSERFDRGGGRLFSIQLREEMVERSRNPPVSLVEAAEFHGGPLEHLARRIHAETLNSDPLSPLAVEGLTLELIAGVARWKDLPLGLTGSPWLAQARDILHDRFREPLALSAVADSVGVHPVHLARTFRRQFRCSVGDYVRRLRVDYACRQLVNSDHPLVDIALSAGFSSQSHFSTTFKQYTGMTPAEYRNTPRSR